MHVGIRCQEAITRMDYGPFGLAPLRSAVPIPGAASRPFVAFDGPDGVGKTTLIRGVQGALQRQGIPCVQLHEWKGGPFERAIRRMSMSEHDPFALFALVLASRCYTLERQVVRSLRDGKTVLLDRYYASSLVYQRLEGIDLNLIACFLQPFPPPDIHFHLTCTARVMQQRLSQKSEMASIVHLERLCQLYDQAFEMLRLRGDVVCSLDTQVPLPATVDEAVTVIVQLRNSSEGCADGA